MERVEFEYVAYVWNRLEERYIQLGITLSESYDICKRIYELHCERASFRKEWDFEERASFRKEWDFENYHIKFRKIVYTDWEVIHD